MLKNKIEMKSKHKEVYTAYYSCAPSRRADLAYVKTQVISDEEFEQKINRLMDCEYYQTNLEYT